MDLRQLRYFLRIAEVGSFTRAAESLRIAQPSLSQHVQVLEDELGVELLTRHARGVTPTDLGLILCDHARTILLDVERAKEAIQSSSDNPAGEVTVGLPTSACRGLAVPLISAVADRYPRISIHLVEAMSGSLDEWLQAGRLDVALLYERHALENVVATEIMTEDLFLIVPKDHRLNDRASIHFEELADVPIVLPSRPHIIRAVVEQAAAHAGIIPNVVVDCDSLPGLVQLVRHGYATIFPVFGVTEEIDSGEMSAIPVLNPTPSWRVSVVVSKLTSNLRAAQTVGTLIKDIAQDLVRDGGWRAQVASWVKRQDEHARRF
jgi:LysR family transcriptional regulator, nitrogen assimilation regulatory protein